MCLDADGVALLCIGTDEQGWWSWVSCIFSVTIMSFAAIPLNTSVEVGAGFGRNCINSFPHRRDRPVRLDPPDRLENGD